MSENCNFKKLSPRKSWLLAPTSTGKLRSPKYGAGQDGIPPSGERGVRRCPLCNRRLRVKALYCIGGEFVAWTIPDHKTRETRNPGPRRRSMVRGRGK